MTNQPTDFLLCICAGKDFVIIYPRYSENPMQELMFWIFSNLNHIRQTSGRFVYIDLLLSRGTIAANRFITLDLDKVSPCTQKGITVSAESLVDNKKSILKFIINNSSKIAESDILTEHEKLALAELTVS